MYVWMYAYIYVYVHDSKYIIYTHVHIDIKLYAYIYIYTYHTERDIWDVRTHMLGNSLMLSGPLPESLRLFVFLVLRSLEALRCSALGCVLVTFSTISRLP